MQTKEAARLEVRIGVLALENSTTDIPISGRAAGGIPNYVT